jgi:hypothetical protein
MKEFNICINILDFFKNSVTLKSQLTICLILFSHFTKNSCRKRYI